MANLEGKTYTGKPSVGSRGYVFVPTPAMRRQGMYYRQYSNGKGGVICYSDKHRRSAASKKFNPRHLPVVINGGGQ